jgi:hypothetical protein
MEQNSPNGVWLEGQIDDTGISLTLISESQDSGAQVEEIKHFSFDELQSKSGDIFSLNLSDETQSAIANSQQSADMDKILAEAQSEISENSQSEIAEGDVLVDENAPDWSDNERVSVVNITDQKAENYVIQEKFGFRDDETVAVANPMYPSNDTVIEAKYLDEDGYPTGNTYAFPESRLVEPEPSGSTLGHLFQE